MNAVSTLVSRFVLGVALVLVLAVGCRDADLLAHGELPGFAPKPWKMGGQPAPAPPDAGSAACAPTITPAQSILVDCTDRVELRSAGDGFLPPAPPGSDCHSEASFTLTTSSHELEWAVCQLAFERTTPWRLQSGNRTLTEDEYAMLIEALRGVTVAQPPTACGADKPTLTLSVATPSATQEYTDSFYSCTDASKVYVDNIDVAYAAFSAAAHP